MLSAIPQNRMVKRQQEHAACSEKKKCTRECRGHSHIYILYIIYIYIILYYIYIYQSIKRGKSAISEKSDGVTSCGCVVGKRKLVRKGAGGAWCAKKVHIMKMR
jgi:hypothetical protein